MSEPKDSLLMDLITATVKHHGGTIKVDENARTFTVTVPSERREMCFQELTEIIGNAEPVVQYTFPLQHNRSHMKA